MTAIQREDKQVVFQSRQVDTWRQMELFTRRDVLLCDLAILFIAWRRQSYYNQPDFVKYMPRLLMNVLTEREFTQFCLRFRNNEEILRIYLLNFILFFFRFVVLCFINYSMLLHCNTVTADFMERHSC
jgi:hypothetical protein